MVWLNIDKPTKKCTLHTDVKCQYVVNKTETDLKGICILKADGGWLEFNSVEDGKDYFK